MTDISNINLNYNRPVKIAEDVYWVGYYDKESGLHCNPYLIVDGDEAVVIDGGSRPDFPTVMMKILQAGIVPSSISALIYQHYDPDLCGSISNFEDIIGRDDLKIISDKENNIFIRHYSVSSPLLTLDDVGNSYTFASGRKLSFVKTPYAHSAGSFVTFDEKTGILFSSDLFGSYAEQWDLNLILGDECQSCHDYNCSKSKSYCPLPDILKFHEIIMTSVKALRYALRQMGKIPYAIIAPQHGSIITKKEDIAVISERLFACKKIGIDGIISD
ncbi:MBL fold metallo-hydrolase [bacterium]|nr:MBL fold metallo-hydrolase [bacterium]